MCYGNEVQSSSFSLFMMQNFYHFSDLLNILRQVTAIFNWQISSTRLGSKVGEYLRKKCPNFGDQYAGVNDIVLYKV